MSPEAAQPSIEAFIPGSRETTNFDYGPSAVDPTSGPPAAAPSVDTTMESGQPGAPPTTDNAATPGSDPALSGYPAEGAPGQSGQPGQPGAPGQPGMVQEGGGRPQSQGITLGQLQDAVYGTSGPYITPGGTVYGGHTLADIQAAVYGGTPPGMPTGNPNTDLTDETSQPSANTNPGRAEAFIPGGRATEFEYAGTPLQALPPAPPSLVEMAQPGGGRSEGIDPGIGPGVQQPDDHDAPEPEDSSVPRGTDPNAPRPQGNIPGQLIGSRGDYTNDQADNPRSNSNYRDSGRTDYPQGRPGITFRSAREAGIEPLFRTQDINVHDTDARLVGNINRALQAMEQRTGIPASSLVATSGWRPAHRGEALEHGQDPRTSQESVYSRYNPNGRNIGPAAPPGHSNHGPGRAIDFSPRGKRSRTCLATRQRQRVRS